MRAKCLHVTQLVLMMQEQHARVAQRGALICRTSILVHNHERHIRAKVMIVEEAAHVLHESSSRHCLVRFSEERGICTESAVRIDITIRMLARRSTFRTAQCRCNTVAHRPTWSTPLHHSRARHNVLPSILRHTARDRST